MSLKKEDTPRSIAVALQYQKLGFMLVATEGTAQTLERQGIPEDRINKIEEGRPNVVNIIFNRDVALVINIPSDTRSQKDGHAFRKNPLSAGLTISTTVAALMTAAKAIESLQKDRWTIRSLQDYYRTINTDTPAKARSKVS